LIPRRGVILVSSFCRIFLLESLIIIQLMENHFQYYHKYVSYVLFFLNYLVCCHIWGLLCPLKQFVYSCVMWAWGFDKNKRTIPRNIIVISPFEELLLIRLCINGAFCSHNLFSTFIHQLLVLRCYLWPEDFFKLVEKPSNFFY